MPPQAPSAVFVRVAGCLACACTLVAWPARALSVRSPAAASIARTGIASPYQAFEGHLSGLERGLFADAADQRLDRHTPLAAALIASGLTDAERVRLFEDRWHAWIDQLERSQTVGGTSIDDAATIFEFMHTRILVGGYNRDTSDPRETLTSGRFNCASASLLYYCLADHFGLAVRALELPGHAMIRLALPDRTFDVETTCPQWFQLRDDPQAQARLLARVRGRTPAGKDPPGPREVTPIHMAAMIYYNRGIDLLAAHQYSEALAANAKALRLDPASGTARGNLLATLNNWSIRLGETGEYAEAVHRLEAGLALDPHYPAFAANYTHVHYHWVHALCRAQRFAEAVAVLERAIGCRPDDGYFRRLLGDVYQQWVAQLESAGQAEEAQRVAARASDDPFLAGQ